MTMPPTAPSQTSHPALLNASCRVALAAYLHDLGKFAERARLEVSPDALGRVNTN